MDIVCALQVKRPHPSALAVLWRLLRYINLLTYLLA